MGAYFFKVPLRTAGRQLAGDVDPSAWLNERIALKATVEPRVTCPESRLICPSG
jgi:hypothetical protein